MAVEYVAVTPTRNLGIIARAGHFASVLVDDILTLENAPEFREEKVDTVQVTPGVKPPQVPVYKAELGRMGTVDRELVEDLVTPLTVRIPLDPNTINAYTIRLSVDGTNDVFVRLGKGAYEGQIINFELSTDSEELTIEYDDFTLETAPLPNFVLDALTDFAVLMWTTDGIDGGWVIMDSLFV